MDSMGECLVYWYDLGLNMRASRAANMTGHQEHHPPQLTGLEIPEQAANTQEKGPICLPYHGKPVVSPRMSLEGTHWRAWRVHLTVREYSQAAIVLSAERFVID